MRKALVAVAFLVPIGCAYAQSSVTIYGTLDLSGKYVKNDGSDRRLSLARDGLNSDQLGFRGIEDLGGGLKAGFNLLASVGADSGDIGTGQSPSGSGKFWSRRSTVSLFSNAGELRMGRDYTPTFWNNAIFDAFGTNGVGSTGNQVQLLTTTIVRADNAIQYFLPPSLGGFYGQAMAAAAEGGSAPGQTANAGRYIGGRFGWAAGPIDVAIAAGQQRNSFGGASQETYNMGGSYDFGLLKLLAYLDRDNALDRRETRGEISAIVPIGQGEIHVGYDRSKLTNTVVPAASFDNTVWQAKLGYVYNLSRRTAFYGTASELSNGPHSNLSVATGTSITALPTLGGKSTGFEVGLRHFF